ncbi:MAG TPA: hypothetical protein VGQ98_04615 [Gemmatimonadaceae bacterium]|nr:hypothetical protein [Gemmatimonadaceae bacterium]
MTGFDWLKAASCAALLATPILLGAQKGPKAEDLRGTWQLVVIKNLKTGEVTQRNGTEWMQFTKSHFTVVGVNNDRPAVNDAKYDSLSAADKIHADYSRVFKDNGDQVFVARAGTWRLSGSTLHETPVMAIYAPIIGVDLPLKIVRLDNRNLVVLNAGRPRSADAYELTYRRID